ncbi:hypothetical protein OG594_44095 [Streptomyces sp. NBC_01214]|uniref:hypothetical protein n=1 Tax=Streptomyces sp. NBC_01214 TaxID=2903777 RepID=UPI0022546717|nr:hypothetical protein [Streptomyces sp. NBC_01214]MCX4808492.1 hypothetical protein [Streptomyces sp. NBC_01214]
MSDPSSAAPLTLALPDGQAIEQVRLHQRGWSTAFTVADMVNQWAWLVREVERGYTDVVEEYSNDLYCRNWLHEAWLLLDDRTVLVWTQRIRELDKRFCAATVDDDGIAMAQCHGSFSPEMWWWRRHPRILAANLGQALQSAGAIGTELDTP